MKILVVGSSGRVGYELVKYLKNENIVVGTVLKNKFSESQVELVKTDITNRNDVEKVIKNNKFDMVIHCAALTNVDLCETNHSLADKININGTQNIVDECIKTNCKIIFFSTSYVFDGSKSKFTEKDKCNPNTYYGHTKSIGEKIIMESGLEHKIIRIDQPYGWKETWQEDNSLTRMLLNFKKGKVREIIDWYNNPTYLKDIAEGVKKLMEVKKSGIYHVVGPDFISRFEWSKIVAEVFNEDPNKIEPIQSSQLNLSVKRAKVNLSNKQICTEIGIKMRGVKDAMREMLFEKQKNLGN
ncbi:SDR family oxidoreductase [Nitrosopumilus sp. S4]